VGPTFLKTKWGGKFHRDVPSNGKKNPVTICKNITGIFPNFNTNMCKLTVKNERENHHTATVCVLSLYSFVRKRIFFS